MHNVCHEPINELRHMNITPPDIEAVNIKEKIAITTDGKVLEITDFLNVFNERCEADEEPVVAIAPSSIGWYRIHLSKYDRKSH